MNDTFVFIRGLPCKFKFDGKTLTNVEPMQFEVVEDGKAGCCKDGQRHLKKGLGGWLMPLSGEGTLQERCIEMVFCPWCGAKLP